MAERESPIRTLKTRRSSTAACLLIAQIEERLSNQSAVLEDSDSFPKLDSNARDATTRNLGGSK